MKKDFKLDVKTISLIVSAILIVVSLFFYSDIAIMGNLILVAVFVGVIPYVFVSYFDYSKIKSMEDKLPTFLLDLSEAQKIGMTLPDALKQVSKTDYGELSKEIKKIDYQISWGIPTQEAMSAFADRIKKSRMIGRVIRIINEAYSSGGDIARTMESTASDIASVKEAEKARKAVTYEHMMIMYAIYFIFIGIVIGLSQTLIPLMTMNVGGGGGVAGGIMSFNDPCDRCAGSTQMDCVNCSVFSAFCSMFKIEKNCYYYALFILMAVSQGIFSGLVAGQIGEGSIIAGLKHSIIMTVSGFGILMFLLKVGMI
jgi:flagellar protein FlaJ